MIANLSVAFRLTPFGQTAQAYAADLAQLLGIEPPSTMRADEPTTDTVFSPSTLFVAHSVDVVRRDVHVLVPFDERAVFSRGRGGILLPFGDGSSGPDALPLAMHLAKKLDVPLIAYHTTWRDEGNPSSRAEDHMCPAARRVQEDIVARTADSGVTLRFVVEMAEEVVTGIIRSALLENARLIVMARGGKTLVGCYVARVLQQSPIPVLAVADPVCEGGCDD